MALEKNSTKKKGLFFKILFFLIIFIVISHLGLFIFLNVKGKDLLKKIISKNYNIEAKVGALSFRFPFTVVIKDFKCADFSFKEADAFLGWINPFTRHFTLHRIYVDSLNLKIKREKDRVSLSPFFTKEITADSKETPKTIAKELSAQTALSSKLGTSTQEKQKEVSFKVGRIYLKNCSIELVDSTQAVPITYIFKNASLDLRHFIYPDLAKFYIKMRASLEKNSTIMENIIDVHGWVDYAHKNMDLGININNLNYSAFSEYYSSFWKPENLGVKEALLSLSSKFNAKNNDLVIEGILSLDRIEYPEPIENNPNAKMLRTVIAFFKVGEEKPTLPIRLRTKMDAFKLDFSSIQYDFKDKIKIGPIVFMQNAIDKAKGVISQKKGQVVEKVKDVGEKAKHIKDVTVDKAVDKTMEVIKDVLGNVKDVVKTESEDKLQGNIASKENAPPQENNQTQNIQQNLSEPTAESGQTVIQTQQANKAGDDAVSASSSIQQPETTAVPGNSQP
jgi:hypothetical protein